jgi:hypothetical protein
MRPVRSIAILLFTAAAALTGCSAHSSTRQNSPPAANQVPATQPPTTPTPSTTPPRTASWQRLPAAPIVGRFAPAGVWTGGQVLVWGGDTRGANQVGCGSFAGTGVSCGVGSLRVVGEDRLRGRGVRSR